MDENETKAPLESSKEESSEETKNDPSDRLTPDHPRFKQVLERAKAAEGRVEEMERKLEQLQNSLQKNETSEYTDDQMEAIETIDRALKSRGYMTQDEFKELQRVQERQSMLTRLNDKYDGSNGLPKFEIDDVVAHAKSNGYGANYEAAYRDLHFDAFVQRAARKSIDPPKTEKPGSKEREVSPGLTMNKINEMSLSEYSKHRAEIAKFFKDGFKK